MMTDPTENYQRQMQKQYEVTAKYRPDESEVRMRREFYSVDAATEFKRQYWPADPFDGVFVGADYLDIPDLVAIHKAAQALKSQGNEVLAGDLLFWKQGQGGTEYDWEAMVCVNRLWLDAKRQRNQEICNLLYEFFWGNCGSFTEKRQEILEMGDAQLTEDVRQVEESLGLTERELKVMEVIDED